MKDNIHYQSLWQSKKTTTRFLAVQGTYAMTFNNYTINDLDNLIDYLYEMKEVLNLMYIDDQLLLKIISTMLIAFNNINSNIAGFLNEKWSIDRINLISLSIIKTAICELMCSKTDKIIIINEYVNIASQILERTEVNFINAILNQAKLIECPLNSDVINFPIEKSESHTILNNS
ncbi:N utilization substance protein B-like protein [Ehrlichia ruminantium]|uniref:N utilization substance protein B homolog n=1 Tax=Ehrlichia ruminantium (strain Welgevonden) TaxID=254945 RepID=A0A0H3LZK9_EHRRW|nr:transcription antitermination protein NusB [Ehrlichia ruminantium]KYW96172.1 nitrogen utilization protein B [Ehrlichia ruminantium]QLK50386.1 transcription antitermination protein NusB [Ehrlichia ruminantium]QLK51310.1 transcription antitermination protein NusB [Ehrlichia ruminantium]QLK52235.1 transcription antitermination protein NusB [Ehrlichia ruminantium]QLK53146.1 transcription antitermination protein NusB [Ehrlichia ruminantium]